MANHKAVEAVDRTLRYMWRDDRPIEGITILFCGDFRQTLPVVPRGTRADEIRACLARFFGVTSYRCTYPYICGHIQEETQMHKNIRTFYLKLVTEHYPQDH